MSTVNDVVTVTTRAGEPPRRMTVAKAIKAARTELNARRRTVAAAICQQLVQQAGNVPAVALLYLDVVVELGDPYHAVMFARNILERLAGDAVVARQAAYAFRLADQHDRAIELMESGLKGTQRDPVSLFFLGMMYQEVGDRQRAAGLFHEALEAHPGLHEAARELARLGELKPRQLAVLERAAKKGEPNPELYIALAEVHRRRGEYDAEMEHLHRGNEILAGHFDYSPEEDEAMVRQIIADHPDLAAGAPARNDFRPIFIVGMPRSGSTLTEQILVSHKDVTGTGETILLRNVIKERVTARGITTPFPGWMTALDDVDFAAIANEYRHRVQTLYGDASVITDKMLVHYLHVGLLVRAFPAARIVYTRRNPLDVCISCYQHALHSVDFTNDLEHIARRWLTTDALMSHWQSVCPERVHVVDYAAMVTDPEAGARALLGFCGLEWDDAVLERRAGARPVKTSSIAQVREGIYTSAVNKWRNYEAHLAGAREILGV